MPCDDCKRRGRCVLRADFEERWFFSLAGEGRPASAEHEPRWYHGIEEVMR